MGTLKCKSVIILLFCHKYMNDWLYSVYILASILGQGIGFKRWVPYIYKKLLVYFLRKNFSTKSAPIFLDLVLLDLVMNLVYMCFQIMLLSEKLFAEQTFKWIQSKLQFVSTLHCTKCWSIALQSLQWWKIKLLK